VALWQAIGFTLSKANGLGDREMNLRDATPRQNFDINSASPDEIAEALAEIALSAGPAILEVYAEDFDSRAKSDGSPVTEADHRAEAIILAALHRLAPERP
jgi:hypothetical protein